MKLARGMTAVITGGSSGIGFALAQRLIEEGLKVAVSGSDASKLARAADMLRKSGGDVLARVADVSKERDMDEFAAAVFDRFHAVNLLSCNAGVNCLRPVLEMSLDDWDWVVRTNLGGTFNTLRAFVPRMLHQTSARHVLYTGSMSCLSSSNVIGLAGYTASRWEFWV